MKTISSIALALLFLSSTAKTELITVDTNEVEISTNSNLRGEN
jgi:hypothetical protein